MHDHDTTGVNGHAFPLMTNRRSARRQVDDEAGRCADCHVWFAPAYPIALDPHRNRVNPSPSIFGGIDGQNRPLCVGCTERRYGTRRPEWVA